MKEEDQGDNEWTEGRAGLVERRVDAVHPAPSMLAGRVGKHGFDRRLAQGAANALGQDQ